MNTYEKIVNFICLLFEIVAAVFLCTMVGIIFYQVIMRYFFNLAPRWSEEVALQLMIWFCFISMLLGVQQNSHIRLEIFMQMLPPKALFAVDLADKVLIGIFGGVTFMAMIPYIKGLSRNTLPATGWPVWIQFAAPCGVGALIVLVIFGQVARQWREGGAAGDKKKNPLEAAEL